MNAWVENLPQDQVAAWIAKNGDNAMQVHMTYNPHFALWLHYVDRAVRRRVHLSYMDLEDWDYWSAYDAGMSPVDAAEQMLADNDQYEWDV